MWIVDVSDTYNNFAVYLAYYLVSLFIILSPWLLFFVHPCVTTPPPWWFSLRLLIKVCCVSVCVCSSLMTVGQYFLFSTRPTVVTSVVGPNQCFGSGSARIRIKICLLDPDPDPHGQMRIRIPEVNKPRKYTVSLGEYRNGNIKVRILL